MTKRRRPSPPPPSFRARLPLFRSRAGASEVQGREGEGPGLARSHAAALTHSPAAVARAWFTHLFTATGAVFGLLALLAITRAEWRAALLWMTAALIVDSADGTLARWSRVKAVLPEFDGALLDNLIDYFTYAVIPAFFLIQAGLLPDGWGLVGAAGIVLASGYQFCRTDAKTEDNYFTGFPSYWNIVLLYLLLLRFDPWLGLGIVVFFCILVFVPFRYVYPSRTRPFRPLTITLSVVWGILCLVAMFTYPNHSPTMVWVSLLYVLYYFVISYFARMREAPPA